MSVYTRNAVYNYVYDRVIQAFPDAYISGMYEPVVPSFPAVFIREIGNFSNPEAVTFGGSQDVWTSTFEVQIQSNKIDTPMSEVYEIFNVVKSAFSSIFYIHINTNNIGTYDDKNYRIVATFRKVIGEADEIPNTNNGG